MLLKGSKLLAIQPANTVADQGGDDQSLPPPILLGAPDEGEQLIQTWGSPWSPLEFLEQAVKAGHPSQLDACLPARLASLAQTMQVTPVFERCKLRIQKTKFLDESFGLFEI